MTQSNDEINLLDIFSKLFSFIRKIIISVVSHFLKNWFVIVAFSVLGIAGGYVKFYMATPIYQSEMVLSSNYLQNDFCAEILDDLQDYVDDKTPVLLAKKLNIDETSAKKICLIEYANFNEKLELIYKDRDTVFMGMPFRIKLITTDNSILNTVETALINYFENNPFVIVQKEIQQENTKSIINKIQGEIVQLDSLKKSVEKNLAPRGVQNGFVFGQPIDPINVYREELKLYREELSLNRMVKINSNNSRIYTHFDVREKPYRPKLSLDLTFGFMAGTIMGFLIATLKAGFRKK